MQFDWQRNWNAILKGQSGNASGGSAEIEMRRAARNESESCIAALASVCEDKMPVQIFALRHRRGSLRLDGQSLARHSNRTLSVTSHDSPNRCGRPAPKWEDEISSGTTLPGTLSPFAGRCDQPQQWREGARRNPTVEFPDQRRQRQFWQPDMSNDSIMLSGNPATGAPGASLAIRAEFAAIAAGFSLLPPLSSGVANLRCCCQRRWHWARNHYRHTGAGRKFCHYGRTQYDVSAGATVTLTLPTVNGTLALLASPTFSGTSLALTAAHGPQRYFNSGKYLSGRIVSQPLPRKDRYNNGGTFTSQCLLNRSIIFFL